MKKILLAAGLYAILTGASARAADGSTSQTSGTGDSSTVAASTQTIPRTAEQMQTLQVWLDSWLNIIGPAHDKIWKMVPKYDDLQTGYPEFPDTVSALDDDSKACFACKGDLGGTARVLQPARECMWTASYYHAKDQLWYVPTSCVDEMALIQSVQDAALSVQGLMIAIQSNRTKVLGSEPSDKVYVKDGVAYAIEPSGCKPSNGCQEVTCSEAQAPCLQHLTKWHDKYMSELSTVVAGFASSAPI